MHGSVSKWTEKGREMFKDRNLIHSSEGAARFFSGRRRLVPGAPSSSLTESSIMSLGIHRVAFLMSRVQHAQESPNVYFIPSVAPRPLFPYYWHAPPVTGSTSNYVQRSMDRDYPRVARINHAVKGMSYQVQGYARSPWGHALSSRGYYFITSCWSIFL